MSSLPQGLLLGTGQTGLGSCDSKKEAVAPGSPSHLNTYPLPHTLIAPHLPVMGGFLY